nr:unnamed protein product [Digitaria exilis]
MEISLEASWVGVQRHGQDLAYRLAQGFSGLLLHAQPPQLPPWSPPQLLPPKISIPFEIDLPVVPFVGGVHRGGGGAIDLPAAAVSSLVEIGGRLGQAGYELGAAVVNGGGGGVIDLSTAAVSSLVEIGSRLGQAGYELGAAVQQLARQVPVPLPFSSEGARCGKWETARSHAAVAADDGEVALASRTVGHTNTTLERVADIGSLEVAAAAAAAATGSATAGSAGGVGAGGADGLDDEEDGFGCEIGTLENVNKAKSFMDVQFPNGQLTYVAGEGITASGFFPLFGGLLQAHGRCPGETRVSFSFKNKQGIRFTPMFQWPDNSLSFGVAQAVAWERSGLMVRPSIQVSLDDPNGMVRSAVRD